jgi:hypothetical protein
VEVLPLLPELLLPELPNLYLLQNQPHVEPVCSKSGKIELPPAAYGTRIFTGRDGHVSANAATGETISKVMMANRRLRRNIGAPAGPWVRSHGYCELSQLWPH